MMIVKVSEDVEYKIGKLQKGIKVSKDIPKFVITGCDKEDDGGQ